MFYKDIVLILFSVILFLLGIVLKIFPPKDRNSFYGFRTRIASKNVKTWKYSNLLCANLLLFFASINFLVYGIFFILKNLNIFYFSTQFFTILLQVLFFVSLFLVILIVQLKTYRKFKDEKKKSSFNFFYENNIGQFKTVPLILLFTIILSVFSVMLTTVNKILIDNYIILEESKVFSIFITLALVYLFILSINYLNKTIQFKLYNNLKIRLQTKYYEQILKSEYSFFCSKNSSDFYYRMFKDIGVIIDFYLNLFLDLPLKFLIMVLSLTIMLFWSWTLTLFCIILFLVQWAVTLIFIKPIKKKYTVLKKAEQELISKTKNDFEVIDVIKGLSIEKLKTTEMHQELSSLSNDDFRNFKTNLLYLEIASLINSLGGIFLILFGLLLVNKNSISLGTVVGITTLASLFFSSINSILAYLNKSQQAKVSFARVDEYLNLEKEKPVFAVNKISAYDISVKNLDFNYMENIIFKNLNLSFIEGKRYLIKGRNGVGKTTLCRLLARYLHPSKGCVFLGDEDIENYDGNIYKENIFFLSQTPVILNKSFKDNIDYNKEYKDANIKKILSEFKLDELLNRKNWNLESIIADNDLSYGEKQKISIVRAILIKPKVLILDEPTSHLDNPSFRDIANILVDFANNNNSTLIIATHDPRLDNYDFNIIEL